jgi:hypothetical protein
MPDERRDFSRIRERLMTFIKHPETGKVRRALTKDIGGIGLCLETEEPYPSGMVLELEMKLPDRKAPIRFTGEVVWSSPAQPESVRKRTHHAIGIRFVRISSRALLIIQQYASLHAPP